MLTLILFATISSPAAPPKFEVTNKVSASSTAKFEVTNRIADSRPAKTLCGCGFAGKCDCWEDECGCSSCKPGAAPTKKVSSSLPHNSTHRCPICGRQSPSGTGTWVVRGYANGGHIHQCDNPSCGQQWWH